MSKIEGGRTPDHAKRTYRQAEKIAREHGVADETGRTEFHGIHGDGDDYSIVVFPPTGREKKPGLFHEGSVFVKGPDTDRSASMMLLRRGSKKSRQTEVSPITPISEDMHKILATLRPNSEEMRKLREETTENEQNQN